MIIKKCQEMPGIVAFLPEVGYSIMLKACNLKARADHIQAQIEYLKQDLEVLQGDLALLWTREELAGVGL